MLRHLSGIAVLMLIPTQVLADLPPPFPGPASAMIRGLSVYRELDRSGFGVWRVMIESCATNVAACKDRKLTGCIVHSVDGQELRGGSVLTILRAEKAAGEAPIKLLLQKCGNQTQLILSKSETAPTSGIKVTALSAQDERALKPKDTFKECDACPEMVVVPAGEFMMGSPQGEPERDTNEGPQHRVTFARQFAVGRFAVTFDEWDACVVDEGCNNYWSRDEKWGRGRRPVINVSWNDAKTYLSWLSRKTGTTYRLLSEAEREYVTRAGTTTAFWWGSSIPKGQANYKGNSTYGGPEGKRTVPVDSFEPNPWGLCQVHGNVWEWTEDCRHDSYAGAPKDGSAWLSQDCTERILRGGPWESNADGLRSASRVKGTTDERDYRAGFRVGRTLAP